MIRSKPNTRARLASHLVLLGLSLPLSDGAVAQPAADQATQKTIALFQAGRYTEALSEAEDIKRNWPTKYDGYYFITASLMRMGMLPEAERALKDAGKHVSPDKSDEHAALEASLDRHKSGFESIKEARAASERGEHHLSATELNKAFNYLPYRYDIGLSAGRLWVKIGDTERAAIVYRDLTKAESSDAKEEARQFLNKNAAAISALLKQHIDYGWYLLDEPYSLLAQESFWTAIAIDPDFESLKPLNMGLSQSPYIGLAVAYANSDELDGVKRAFKDAWDSGLRISGTSFPHKQGAKLAQALCTDDLQSSLKNIYGPPAGNWARAVCFEGKTVAVFDGIQKEFSAAKTAASNGEYVKAEGLFRKVISLASQNSVGDLEKRKTAKDLSQRAECNIAYLNAWADAGDDDKVREARVCGPDFSVEQLEARNAEFIKERNLRNSFEVKVCNKAEVTDFSFAIVRRLPADYSKWVISGWYSLDKDQCKNIASTFGNENETDFFVTGSSSKREWWPKDGADSNRCISSSKTERVIVAGYKCGPDEDLRGFRKIVVRKDPARNGATYNFRMKD
jgi:Protein of unknown function (DUF1036)